MCSNLIHGERKKYKITTEQIFMIACGPIKQLRLTENFRYLSMKISPLGVEEQGVKLHRELVNITKAPVERQQRLKNLRCFFVWRFYHLFVLSLCLRKTLKALDVQVKMVIRRWLSLLHNTLLGYFHVRCRDGGVSYHS